MGVAKHTITPRHSLASTHRSLFPLSSLISLSYVLMLVKKLVRKLDNLPWLAQEGRSSPWPRLSQSSTISYSTLITFISSSSLSKSRSSVCHQGDVWHVLYVAFNCIDKPDKIVRLTGNWTEGGISLFEWSIHTKLAEVCIQILKSVISVSLKLVV